MKIKRTGKHVKTATSNKCKISAARAGKTKEVIVLQGNYGYGWDDLVEYEKDQQHEAKQDLADYRENERNAQHRLIRRCVANPSWSAPTDRFSVLTYECGFKYKKDKPTKFSDIDEAITYANQLWEAGEEVLLKDSVTGCNVQLIPNNIYWTNRNIERFKETVNTDAGIIESSTQSKRKFTVKASYQPPYARWVFDEDDNMWKQYSASNSPTVPDDFLEKINHREYPNMTVDSNYTDVMVLPNDGSVPDDGRPVKEYDIAESTSVGKRKFTVKASKTNITASTGDAVDVNEVKDILWNAGFSETEVKETRTHLGTEYKILIGGAGEEKPELDGSSIIDTLRSAGYTVEFDTVAEGWMYLFITDNRTEPKYLYRVSYDYTSDIVEMDDETSDYQAVIDKLIDDMETTGNTGYLIGLDEAEAEYSEDMYTIGGNHGLALIHNGNLNIEPLGWSNEVGTQYDTVHSSTNISCSEDSEIIWEPIPESVDDAGKPTTWSTSVNGEFFWISKKPNGRYDVERNQNGRYIPVSDELANLGSLYDAEKEFDEWLEESDINSATDIKASIGGKSSSTDDFEYYKALADKVVEYANTYFDNLELTNLVYDISDKMLTFTDIAGGRNEVVYIIPLENITPNWDDLEADADELYESMMGSLLPF